MISLRDVVMIHDLKMQGLSNTAIARQLGISRRTVTRRLQQGLEAPILAALPKEWQATYFVSHLILYKKSRFYVHGTQI